MTYIATEEGWLYLAVVMDLFSRRIVGWSMKTTVDRSLVVIDALEMACLGRRPKSGEAIFHSDRGSQYASEDFGEVMKLYGLIPSMSRKANCWDAVTETLFGSLKVERLHGETFFSVRAAKDAVIGWILWYNQRRMHSTIGYQSPVEFEQAWQREQSKAAA